MTTKKYEAFMSKIINVHFLIMDKHKEEN